MGKLHKIKRAIIKNPKDWQSAHKELISAGYEVEVSKNGLSVIVNPGYLRKMRF